MSTTEEALVEAAYYRIADENGLTIMPVAGWGVARAKVPPHWLEEATKRAQPMIDDLRAGRAVLDAGWFCLVHDGCTCGAGGPNGYYGAHEPGCGHEPLFRLEAAS